MKMKMKYSTLKKIIKEQVPYQIFDGGNAGNLPLINSLLKMNGFSCVQPNSDTETKSKAVNEIRSIVDKWDVRAFYCLPEIFPGIGLPKWLDRAVATVDGRGNWILTAK